MGKMEGQDKRRESRDIRQELCGFAKECTGSKGTERPELTWLKRMFDRIRIRYGLRSKAETDRFLFERIYGREARTPTEYLKIRYWRTGKYMPINRELCLRLGEALELSEEEMSYLLRAYYDHSLHVYNTPQQWSSGEYLEKCAYMDRLIDTYLKRFTEEKLKKLRIPPQEREHYFRHLYYTDAYHYVSVSGGCRPDVLRKHITSTSYDSELKRQIALRGEIPRKTMLRHLLILGASELTLEKINEQLAFFGYLELQDDHTLAGGEYLDRVVIRLLREYENIRMSSDPEDSLTWFQGMCRELDAVFVREDCPRMRFMHFKALDI